MPRDETARLEALRRYQILDTSAEQAFDDLAILASRISGTPMAAVSLIDADRQWFKARVGLEATETPRAIAFCAHTIQQKSALVVPNAAKDDRFRESPLVKVKDGIRFYAGVPIITPDGHAIGTISVMDRKARTLEPEQIRALEALGRQAEKQLEVRTYIDRLARTIEERESVERRLRDVNHFTSAIIEGAGEGIVVYDRSFRYVVWNRFMEELTGMPARHVLGQSAIQLFPHFREQGIATFLQKALGGEKVTPHSYKFHIPQTGRSGWVSATYGPNRDASGAITGVIGVVRDVTQEKQSKEALSAAEAKFRGLVEQSLVGIYVIQDGRYQYVNPKLAEIFGYTPDEMLAMDSVMSLVSEEDRGVVQENIRRRLAGEAQTVRYSFRALRKDGQEIELEVHGAATEFQGRPAIIGTLLDITDRKRAEAQIVYHAYHDPLTELPNRMLFMERLRLQLAQARRQSRKLSIVYFDLDHFKFVNDTLGHSVGDEFLQTVATRLKGLVREMDTVARVGGDEFVILIPDVSRAEDISIVAQKLLNSVARPLQVEGRALNITASIGIATFPADGEDAETLLRNADTAMYRAKELGRNNFQLCTPELTSKAVERLTIQNGLRLALDRDELVLHYQPVVSLTSGRIVGLEALVRWQHAEKGLIMPGAFISVAEETGLILPLGEWVLGSAAKQLKQWQNNGLPDLRMAVNVSARQFREPSLVRTIERALGDSEVKPQHLEIEITESIAMESAEVVVANLESLRNMAVGISIDDFGTGYSSLTYLKRYPINSLKIDRSFVTDVATNPADAGIVRAVVEMAHGMKLNVIAEGVETKDQFAHLQKYGCDEMQGYWFSKPLPVEAINKLLAEEKKLWTPQA
ncbi:MAG TPA: EAL domain-containing protein [Thermoanaerobaculia bacterium]|jgi:diguanylate cyclase (GGDEF)-like protein/PAS domain S-box-containing protein